MIRRAAGAVLYLVAALLLAAGATLMLKAAGLLAEERDDWE